MTTGTPDGEPATPVTVPVVFTEAIEASAVLHAPPEVASVKVIVAPVHTEVEPPIAATEGTVITEIDFVTVVGPQPLLTV